MPKAYAPAPTAEASKPTPAGQAIVRRAPGLAAEEPALADRGAQGLVQRQLAEIMACSPGVLRQKAFGDHIQNGAAAIAQRRQIDGLFGKAASLPVQGPAPAPNDTGLPDRLKAGIESLSGLSLDNVKVHYNSSKPAQLDAHAFAQGRDIHVAPGQERHLPHEAWHVVQQAQGRVRATEQSASGVMVNTSESLEGEADRMGGQASQHNGRSQPAPAAMVLPGANVAQLGLMDFLRKMRASYRDAKRPLEAKAARLGKRAEAEARGIGNGYQYLENDDEQQVQENKISNQEEHADEQFRVSPVKTMAVNAAGSAISHVVGIGSHALNAIAPGAGSVVGYAANKGIARAEQAVMDRVVPVNSYQILGSDGDLNSQMTHGNVGSGRGMVDEQDDE